MGRLPLSPAHPDRPAGQPAGDRRSPGDVRPDCGRYDKTTVKKGARGYMTWRNAPDGKRFPAPGPRPGWRLPVDDRGARPAGRDGAEPVSPGHRHSHAAIVEKGLHPYTCSFPSRLRGRKKAVPRAIPISFGLFLMVHCFAFHLSLPANRESVHSPTWRDWVGSRWCSIHCYSRWGISGSRTITRSFSCWCYRRASPSTGSATSRSPSSCTAQAILLLPDGRDRKDQP